MGSVPTKLKRKRTSDSAKEVVAVQPAPSHFCLSNEKISYIRKRLSSLTHDNAHHKKLEAVYFYLPCYSLELSIHGVCTFLLYQSHLVIACSLLPWYYEESLSGLVFFKTAPVVYAPKSRLTVGLKREEREKLVQLAKREKHEPDFVRAKDIPIRRAEEGGVTQTTGTIRLHNNLRHLISIAPKMFCTYIVDNIENVRSIEKAPDQFYLPSRRLIFDLRPRGTPQLPPPSDETLQQKEDTYVIFNSSSIIDEDRENDELWNMLSKDTVSKTSEEPTTTATADTTTAGDMPTASTLLSQCDDCASNSGGSEAGSPASTSTHVVAPLEEIEDTYNLGKYFCSTYALHEVEFWLQTDEFPSHRIITTAFCSHESYERNCLCVSKGDTLEVLSRTSSGWSLCRKGEVVGWIPTAVVPFPSAPEAGNHVATIRPVTVVQQAYIASNIDEMSVFQGDAVVFLNTPEFGFIRIRVYGMPFREGYVPVQCFQPATLSAAHFSQEYTQENSLRRPRLGWRRKGTA